MLASVGNYLLYFVSTLVLLVVAMFIYIKVLPYDELALIRKGNTAAAIALAGTMIGYAVVLWSATAHAANPVDAGIWSALVVTAMWSGVALVTQIAAFELVHLVFRDFKAEMEKGDVAYGIILGAFSLAIGVINAGCLT
jgi:putative membrane protein